MNILFVFLFIHYSAGMPRFQRDKVEAISGQNITLQCKFPDGDGVKFYKGNMEMGFCIKDASKCVHYRTSRHVNYSLVIDDSEKGIYSLNILNCNSSQSGTYMCVDATNIGVGHNCSVSVAVSDTDFPENRDRTASVNFKITYFILASFFGVIVFWAIFHVYIHIRRTYKRELGRITDQHSSDACTPRQEETPLESTLRGTYITSDSGIFSQHSNVSDNPRSDPDHLSDDSEAASALMVPNGTATKELGPFCAEFGP